MNFFLQIEVSQAAEIISHKRQRPLTCMVSAIAADDLVK